MTTDTLQAAYQNADRILLDCAAGDCPNEKQSEIHFPNRGVIHTCTDCWNRHVAARKEVNRLRREQGKEEGRRYWQQRGIRVGQKVRTFARSMLGFGGMVVYGTAKVGVNGAYVSAPRYQKGQLDPDCFEPAE